MPYEEKKDIWCQMNPPDAIDQLEDTRFSEISTKHFKLINNIHIQVCYPALMCKEDICLLCSHPELYIVDKCYQIHGNL